MAGDLKAAALVVQNESGEKLVQLQLATADGRFGTQLLMDGVSAKALGTALAQAGESASSPLIVPPGARKVATN